MSTVWVRGVPWYSKALDAATRRGVADAVTDAALAHLTGRGSVAVYPDETGDGRVRVQQGEVAAVIGRYGVVIGFTARSDASEAVRPDPRPARAYKAPSGSGKHLHGPATWAELHQWLEEEGYTISKMASGHAAVFDPSDDNRRIGTIASTASDHRTLPNTVSDLRRAGARLRKESK